MKFGEKRKRISKTSFPTVFLSEMFMAAQQRQIFSSDGHLWFLSHPLSIGETRGKLMLKRVIWS
jgi:hypothetical protein